MTDVVEVLVDQVSVVEVVGVGPQGQQGPVGPPGVPLSYLHTQASAASTWTVNHNLGFVPTATVYSVGGVEVEAEIAHTSVNQAVIQFVTPTAGTARFV